MIAYVCIGPDLKQYTKHEEICHNNVLRDTNTKPATTYGGGTTPDNRRVYFSRKRYILLTSKCLIVRVRAYMLYDAGRYGGGGKRKKYGNNLEKSVQGEV